MTIFDRKETLSKIHSRLRSDENLRPDEALDALVDLYHVWMLCGPLSPAEVVEKLSVKLSPLAVERAVELLWPYLAATEREAGADIFQELAGVGIRAGMGQYFTPHVVADAIAWLAAPQAGERWLDPFCGSATLLGTFADACLDVEVLGQDRDQRVLKLAAIEAEAHNHADRAMFRHGNALDPAAEILEAFGVPGGVDGIVTNPPFGAEVALAEGLAERFELWHSTTVPLEFLAMEQCWHLLKPEGKLAIVLPQSVLSNKRAARVRNFLARKFHVDGILSLPPETFLPFKGVAKASVVFATKRETSVHSVRLGISLRCGWDGSGRPHGISDLDSVSADMQEGVTGARTGLVQLDMTQIERNLTAEWNLRSAVAGIELREMCDTLFTGNTPARAAYSDPDNVEEHAVRILKVADLTGEGIDWVPGDRSFAVLKRPKEHKYIRQGDIVMTAAAHHPRYIAAKVDIIDDLHELGDRRVFASGEVLVIRPSDPEQGRRLLLWFRTAEGRAALQSCVTGQTAHLQAEYVADIMVPHSVLAADIEAASQAFDEASRLRRESKALAVEAASLFVSSVERVEQDESQDMAKPSILVKVREPEAPRELVAHLF